MEKKSVLNQVECVMGGSVQVRIDKQIVEGDAVISQRWHRTIIELDGDVDLQMGLVNEHLKEEGWPSVSVADVAKIKAICTIHQKDYQGEIK